MENRYAVFLKIKRWFVGEDVKSLMKVRRLQCDFIVHLRLSVLCWYLVLALSVVVVGKSMDQVEYVALALIPLMWHFFYKVFYDNERNVFADDYSPNNVDKASMRIIVILTSGFIIAFAVARLCGINSNP